MSVIIDNILKIELEVRLVLRQMTIAKRTLAQLRRSLLKTYKVTLLEKLVLASLANYYHY